MSWIVVDVESDGPLPGKHSMVCFGAVVVDPTLSKTFYGRTKPISEEFISEALAVSGFTREDHQSFDDPADVMRQFRDWITANSHGRPILVSDNLLFDGMWMNYYFHTYLGENPFGHSGRRIGDLHSGLVKDTFASWKHLRKTTHTHHPVDDAKGNAEAILALKEMGLKIPSK
jgi:DNA polymerase III epsilon subunit-like protein